MHSGADAECREHLVQVPPDGARAEDELRADVLIGLPARGEPRDLILLRGELATCLVTPFAYLLAGGEQLAAGAFFERGGAAADEQLLRRAGLPPRGPPAGLPPPPIPPDPGRAGGPPPARRAGRPGGWPPRKNP